MKQDKIDGARYREYMEAELEAAAMYSALAEVEGDPDRAGIFRDLAEAELRHAGRWAGKLGISLAGVRPPPLGMRGRLMRLGARVFGTRRVLPLLLRIEAKETNAYAADPEARDLVMEERKHTRVLRGMTTEGQAIGSNVMGASGSLRAAVLAVNDGLVSNFSLVMGVAGGTGNPDFILLAGVAGLMAGAFSMAAGEYVSMRAQRDIFENEISKEKVEIREWPEEEREELVLIYRAKGLSEEEAGVVADRVMSDPDVALDTMAREELGLDPSALGAPWGGGCQFVHCLYGRRGRTDTALPVQGGQWVGHPERRSERWRPGGGRRPVVGVVREEPVARVAPYASCGRRGRASNLRCGQIGRRYGRLGVVPYPFGGSWIPAPYRGMPVLE